MHVLMQSDCSNSSLFFAHYNRNLLCDWVLRHCSVCSFQGVSCHKAFVLTWSRAVWELVSYSAVVLCQVLLSGAGQAMVSMN